ncbi:hypothetical protein DPMN_079508 [Dreissena polymorpha]|uniref:Uncharacterized protein n=1 Tax=Dreissena polymorpha TaxID=45954 RepID=A0A9D3YP60_DREPO|nr:hypothetical protein DPMN_079508 [Dreissena polymorpha]
METSDVEETTERKTPPKKIRNYGGSKEKLERRRAAVTKYTVKEMEEIEACKLGL